MAEGTATLHENALTLVRLLPLRNQKHPLNIEVSDGGRANRLKSIQMGCSYNGYVRVNQYALVSYIPKPLGTFLDELRLKLSPGCRPHAHVTILPPRPLEEPVERVEQELLSAASQFHFFEIKLGEVEIFEKSKVIFIGVAQGGGRLRHMHETLNCGAAKFKEPFQFHPHITLAQNLPDESVEEMLKLARDRWSQWDGPVTFPVDELAFVQNTEENIWLDLLHIPLVLEPAGLVR